MNVGLYNSRKRVRSVVIGISVGFFRAYSLPRRHDHGQLACQRRDNSFIIKIFLTRRITLKEGIHPQYQETRVECACGETFVTRSTKQKIHVDICSKCHPFFTGKQKIVDAEGRVEKFKKKYEKK